MPHHMSDTETRYKPCQVLSDHKTPYVIWFEDTLHHYGVPTLKFDLYLLVMDLDKAAELLVKAGWVLDTQGPHVIGNAKVERTPAKAGRFSKQQDNNRSSSSSRVEVSSECRLT